MSEVYPVILSGKKCGELTVERQGLFTVFSARCADPGGLVRLSVYGPGGEGYLGVMEPQNGELRLYRRLSRAGAEAFPDSVEYAAEAGKGRGEATPAEPPEQAPEPTVPEPPFPPAEEPDADPPPQDDAAPGPPEPPAVSAAPEPDEGTDVLWYEAGDGSLFTTWRGRDYRAIPMSAWGLPMEHAVEERTIDGVRYAVFALENGQIL